MAASVMIMVLSIIGNRAGTRRWLSRQRRMALCDAGSGRPGWQLGMSRLRRLFAISAVYYNSSSLCCLIIFVILYLIKRRARRRQTTALLAACGLLYADDDHIRHRNVLWHRVIMAWQLSSHSISARVPS